MNPAFALYPLTRIFSATALAALLFLVLPTSVPGQIPISGSSYSENFDTVLVSGSTTVPSGWTLVGKDGPVTTLSTSDGIWAGTAANTYNAALQTNLTATGDSSSDRGLSIYSTAHTETRYIEAQFINSTGGDITELEITFNVVLYAARFDDETGDPRWDGLNLLVNTGGGFSTTSPLSEAVFTNAEIDFASGGGTPWDGIANGWATSGMIAGGNKKAVSTTLTGISIADGATFTLRWASNDGGNTPTAPGGSFGTLEQSYMNIGVDDLVLNATTTGSGTVPDAPTGLSATTINSDQIDLSWTDTSTNETGFRIERSLASGGPWTPIATTAINVTSYSDLGLDANTPYYYQIFAVNEVGDSASPSTEANATTDTAAAGTVQFTTATYSGSENAGTITISAERINDVAGAVSIDYATSDDSATTADSDYVATSGTLNWADGEGGIKSFTVTVNDDNAVESDEDFTVALSTPGGGVILGSPDTATVTITNDDAAGTLEFTASAFPVNEDAGTVTLTVSRSGGNDGAVSVNYTTFEFAADPTFPPVATETDDYTPTSGTLNWADQDSADKEIVVTIVNDSIEEYYQLDDPNFTVTPITQYLEEFGVVLSGIAGGATLGTSGTVVGITDNDQNVAPAITVDSPTGASAKFADVGDGLVLETTVTDDGLGADPYSVTLVWSQVSGPGTATFADDTAEDTTVTFDVAGEYVLRLTADDGRASVTADITANPGFVASGGGSGELALWPLQANLNPSNVTPALDTVSNFELVSLVDRGYDGIGFEFDGSGSSFGNDYLKVRLSAAPGALIDLNGGTVGMAVDYINGTSSLAGWRCDVISDPDGVATSLTLAESTDREDDIDSGIISGFEPANTVEIRIYFKNASWGDWNVANLSVSGTVGSGNLGPDVSAGSDTTGPSASAFALAGSATDDGLPESPGAVSYQWTQLSGPDTVVFADATNPTSNATFPVDGSYVLQLAASDGEVTTLDSVTYSIGALSPAESWRDIYFNQTANTGDAADGNDFDEGGMPNLIERAFGTDPTNDLDDVGLVVGTMNDSGSDYLVITYRRLTGGSGTTGVNYTVDDLTYTVEYDSDLVAPWSSGSVVAVGSPIDNSDGTETVTVRLTTPISSGDTQFVRLSVTSTP